MVPTPTTVPPPSSSIAPPIALVAILLVFLSALAGALLPLYILAKSNPTTSLLRLGNSFAAGILSSAGLVHLLPSGDRALRSLFPHIRYPFAGPFALLGVAAVFLLDHLIRRNIPPTQPPRQSLLIPHPSPSNPPISTVSATVTYILAAALSLHSLIEGLTLGASVIRTPQFLAVLSAIVAHKTFAAISLGTSLAGMVLSHPRRGVKTAAVITAVTFALLTPIGAAVGLAMVRVLDERHGSVVSAALNCVSAGVFLYVAFVELLGEELKAEEKSAEGGRCALVFVVAAALMSLLAVWI